MHYQTIFLPNDHFSFQRSFFIQTIFLPNITTHNLINSIKEKTKHKMSKGKNKNNKKVNATDVEKNRTKKNRPNLNLKVKQKKKNSPPIRPPRHSHSWLCRHLNHLRTPLSIVQIFPTPLTSRRSTSG